MRRLIEEVVAPSREATVVDVGCGTGANIAALADGYRCVGIDTSAEAVELARQRFPEVRFLVGRAPEDLGELMQQADVLMLMDVLEHVDDDFAMFSQLAAAAEPGTHFLVTVPADESLWSEHDESFGHYRRYDRRRLESVWDGLPLRPLMVSYLNARLMPLVRLVRTWNRRRRRASGRAGTDFWMPHRHLNHLLEGLLAGEAKRMIDLLHGRRRDGARSGSSLVALLRREHGTIDVRTKPPDLPPDRRQD